MDAAPSPLDFRDYDTRLAAYGVVVDGGRLLLALWHEPAEPLWTMPGGGVELEESAEDGVVRELREETGYDVEVLRILGVDSHVVPSERRLGGSRTPRPLKAMRLYCEVRIGGGRLRPETDGSTDDARWFDLQDVTDLARTSSVDVALGLLDRREA